MRRGLVEGGVLLKVGLKVLKAHRELSLPHGCVSRYELSAMLQHHACLPASAMLPATMVTDSNPLKL